MGILVGAVLVLVGIVTFVLARRRRRRIESSGGDVRNNLLEIVAIAIFVAGFTSAAFSLHR